MCFKRKTVLVHVCESTNLLPNAYCPSVVERRFYKGQEPKTVCAIHHADPPVDPLPIADHSIPRTGMDDYAINSRSFAEQKKYLVDGTNAGMSVLRSFLVYTWGDVDEDGALAGWRFCPYLQVGWWVDGGRRYPLFSVTEFDETNWEKYRLHWRLMARLQQKETVSAIDGCSFPQSRYFPLFNCYQHHGAEPGTSNEFEKMDGTIGHGLGEHTGGIYGGFGGDAGGTMRDYILLLYQKLYNELTATGVEFDIMVGNELYVEPIEGHTQEMLDKILYDFHEWIITYLKSLGLPEDRILVSIAGAHDRARVTAPLKAKFPGLIIQWHGPNSPQTLTRFLDMFPGDMPDGDGFDNKAEGYTNGENYTMPSLAQCREMRQILIDRGVKEFHLYMGYIEDTYPPDIGRARWDEQLAIAGRRG